MLLAGCCKLGAGRCMLLGALMQLVGQATRPLRSTMLTHHCCACSVFVFVIFFIFVIFLTNRFEEGRRLEPIEEVTLEVDAGQVCVCVCWGGGYE